MAYIIHNPNNNGQAPQLPNVSPEWAAWSDKAQAFMHKYLRKQGKEFTATLADLQAAEAAFYLSMSPALESESDVEREAR